MFSKRVVGVEGFGVGVEGVSLVDRVDAVEDGCAVITVYKKGGLAVDCKDACGV
jgi:hypothetical protein